MGGWGLAPFVAVAWYRLQLKAEIPVTKSTSSDLAENNQDSFMGI